MLLDFEPQLRAPLSEKNPVTFSGLGEPFQKNGSQSCLYNCLSIRTSGNPIQNGVLPVWILFACHIAFGLLIILLGNFK